MANWKIAVRDRIRGFLGLHPASTLSGQAFYDDVAHHLMYTPRVFGDRARLIIGNGVVLNDAIINTSSGSVRLHDYVFFGHGVTLLTGTHDYRRKNRARQTAIPEAGRDITIREGAWLGSNVTIIGPCTIGAHAVVAAGSVVLQDVEPGAIYAGCPAKKIKMIEFGAS